MTRTELISLGVEKLLMKLGSASQRRDPDNNAWMGLISGFAYEIYSREVGIILRPQIL